MNSAGLPEPFFVASDDSSDYWKTGMCNKGTAFL